METQKHSPLPWRINLSGNNGKGSHKHQIASGDATIGYAWCPTELNGTFLSSKDEHDANAAFIIRACNNHYKLIEALNDILWLRPVGDCKNETITQIEQIARKALAEAEAA